MLSRTLLQLGFLTTLLACDPVYLRLTVPGLPRARHGGVTASTRRQLCSGSGGRRRALPGSCRATRLLRTAACALLGAGARVLSLRGFRKGGKNTPEPVFASGCVGQLRPCPFLFLVPLPPPGHRHHRTSFPIALVCFETRALRKAACSAPWLLLTPSRSRLSLHVAEARAVSGNSGCRAAEAVVDSGRRGGRTGKTFVNYRPLREIDFLLPRVNMQPHYLGVFPSLAFSFPSLAF